MSRRRRCTLATLSCILLASGNISVDGSRHGQFSRRLLQATVTSDNLITSDNAATPVAVAEAAPATAAPAVAVTTPVPAAVDSSTPNVVAASVSTFRQLHIFSFDIYRTCRYQN